jgi:hypothetical protein
MTIITPNWFATIALVVWPLVALVLYSTRPVNQATLWTILGGYLLLPVAYGIKFQGVPSLDKSTLTSLSALVGCTFIARRPIGFFRQFGITEGLLLTFLIVPFITSELNTDPIVIGDTFLPGSSHYDALSASVGQFLIVIPFFVGRRVLRDAKSNAEILRVLVVAGLAYSLLELFEVRMSPYLHIWVYGYFPHDFYQMVRDGGFRPVVFLGHGLVVAFFAMTVTVASAALWRTDTRVTKVPPAAVTGYLGLVLLLCKSMGSIVYAAVLVPVVRWVEPRNQLRIAVILAAIAITYPMLRTEGLIPTTNILNTVRSVNSERAASLAVRFENEDRLLAHAFERPWFGWGRFARGRVYMENGADFTITDGYWTIVLSTFGLFGFFAEFGLLTIPIFSAFSALKYAESNRDRVYLGALTLIAAINVIELLPNATQSPWTWLLAGALLGRAESLRAAERSPRQVSAAPSPVAPASRPRKLGA